MLQPVEKISTRHTAKPLPTFVPMNEQEAQELANALDGRSMTIDENQEMWLDIPEFSGTLLNVRFTAIFREDDPAHLNLRMLAQRQSDLSIGLHLGNTAISLVQTPEGPSIPGVAVDLGYLEFKGLRTQQTYVFSVQLEGAGIAQEARVGPLPDLSSALLPQSEARSEDLRE